MQPSYGPAGELHFLELKELRVNCYGFSKTMQPTLSEPLRDISTGAFTTLSQQDLIDTVQDPLHVLDHLVPSFRCCPSRLGAKYASTSAPPSSISLLCAAGTSRPRFCAGHKTKDMIGLKNRPCLYPG